MLGKCRGWHLAASTGCRYLNQTIWMYLPALPSPELFLYPDAGAAHSPSPHLCHCGKARHSVRIKPSQGSKVWWQLSSDLPSILP